MSNLANFMLKIFDPRLEGCIEVPALVIGIELGSLIHLVSNIYYVVICLQVY